MARYDDLNTNMIAYTTLISCLLLIAIIQATQALCFNLTNAAQQRKLEQSEFRSSVAVIREQLDSINGYRKVTTVSEDGQSPESKRLEIPISRAMELILEEGRVEAPSA